MEEGEVRYLSRHCVEEGAKWSSYHKSANVPSIFQSGPPWLFPRKERKRQAFFPFWSKIGGWRKKYVSILKATELPLLITCSALSIKRNAWSSWWCIFSPHASQRLEARFFSSLPLPPQSFVRSFAFSGPAFPPFFLFSFRIYGKGTRAACLSGEGGWRVEVTALSPCATEHTWAEDGLSRMESKFHKAWFVLYCFRKPVACAHLCSEVNCWEMFWIWHTRRKQQGEWWLQKQQQQQLFKPFQDRNSISPLFEQCIYLPYFLPAFSSLVDHSLLWPDWSGGNPIFFCAVALSGSTFCDFISDWLEVTSFECRNVARNYDRGGRSNRKEEVEGEKQEEALWLIYFAVSWFPFGNE